MVAKGLEEGNDVMSSTYFPTTVKSKASSSHSFHAFFLISRLYFIFLGVTKEREDTSSAEWWRWFSGSTFQGAWLLSSSFQVSGQMSSTQRGLPWPTCSHFTRLLYSFIVVYHSVIILHLFFHSFWVFSQSNGSFMGAKELSIFSLLYSQYLKQCYSRCTINE